MRDRRDRPTGRTGPGSATAASPEALADARLTLTREWTRLRRSPVLAAGGWATFDGLLDASTLASLLDEALGGPVRHDCVVGNRDREQIRGGEPSRRLVSVAGGPTLAALYGHALLTQFLRATTGLRVRPCGPQASYARYEEAGAHLAIHRDVRGCDLALIACLADDDPRAASTEVWPDDGLTPLDQLRAGGGHRSQRLTLAPGHVMLLHGGIVPHRIVPTGAGRRRVVALMCFEAEPG